MEEGRRRKEFDKSWFVVKRGCWKMPRITSQPSGPSCAGTALWQQPAAAEAKGKVLYCPSASARVHVTVMATTQRYLQP